MGLSPLPYPRMLLSPKIETKQALPETGDSWPDVLENVPSYAFRVSDTPGDGPMSQERKHMNYDSLFSDSHMYAFK